MQLRDGAGAPSYFFFAKFVVEKYGESVFKSAPTNSSTQIPYSDKAPDQKYTDNSPYHIRK